MVWYKKHSTCAPYSIQLLLEAALYSVKELRIKYVCIGCEQCILFSKSTEFFLCHTEKTVYPDKHNFWCKRQVSQALERAQQR